MQNSEEKNLENERFFPLYLHRKLSYYYGLIAAVHHVVI
jgi:hypothetical protein